MNKRHIVILALTCIMIAVTFFTASLLAAAICTWDSFFLAYFFTGIIALFALALITSIQSTKKKEAN